MNKLREKFKPQEAKELVIKYDDNGKPVVYSQRWHVLAAFSLGYFFWNFQAYRATPLTAEYALYFDTTNEVSLPEDYGIDILVTLSNFIVIIGYPIAGVMVDRYGLEMMKIGVTGLCLASWWWYLSFHSFLSVMLSKFCSGFSGVLIVTSLLRLSSQWFPVEQRAMAIAIGAISSTFGAGLGLVFFPALQTGEDIIDLRLKSCKQDFIDDFLSDQLDNVTAENAYMLQAACTNEAQDEFCCAAETDIEFINLLLAIMGTIIAAYACLVVKDCPPTAPSVSGNVKKGATFKESMSWVFSRDRWHYLQICVADFIASGPPIVLFSTISRVFPARIADLSVLAGAAGLILGIPAGGVFSYYLGKTKKYFEFTSKGYLIGAIAWIVVTISIAIDNTVGDVLILLMSTVAILAYVLWSVSVYELKIEYVFNHEVSYEGFIIAMDRTIINLSSLVFILAIPPERYNGPGISGRMFTFLVGGICMIIGVFLVYTIKNKRVYTRLQYELEYLDNHEKDSLDKGKEAEKKLSEASEADVKVAAEIEAGEAQVEVEAKPVESENSTNSAKTEEKEVQEAADEQGSPPKPQPTDSEQKASV